MLSPSSCLVRILSVLGILVLGGCDTLNHTASTPDYTIRVMPAADGRKMVAVPPTCPDWATVYKGPLDNQATPQLGCATARNLAMMVEDPRDLVRGRTMDARDATVSAMSIQAYHLSKTKALIDPNAKEVRAAAPVTLPGTTQ